MTPHRLTHWISRMLSLCVILSPAWTLAESPKAQATQAISEGKEVSLEYTLKLKDDEVIDTNVGEAPLKYTQGAGQIISGLESALEGMKAGDTKHVTIDPEDGYGAVNPNAFQEVPKEQIPDEALKVGTMLIGRDGQGNVVRPRVSEIKQDTVVLDFNHPLAGKTLYFEVKVLDVH